MKSREVDLSCLKGFFCISRQKWGMAWLATVVSGDICELDLTGRLPNTSLTLISKMPDNCCSEQSSPMYWVCKTLERHRNLGLRPDLWWAKLMEPLPRGEHCYSLHLNNWKHSELAQKSLAFHCPGWGRNKHIFSGQICFHWLVLVVMQYRISHGHLQLL